MKKQIIFAVANQIQNMMYNDITCENGVESFECWCNDGEVFENEGMDAADVKECMQLVRVVAPLVDELILNHLNIDNPDKVSVKKEGDVRPTTWTDKLNAIIEAARNQTFADEIDDIDRLSYTKVNGKGEKETFEERFDHIDTTTIPVSVHFICGTGYENYSVPIGWLTDESIDELYECVINK